MKGLLGKLLREAFAAITPIALTVALLHVTLVPLGDDVLRRFIAAAVFVGSGIALFLAAFASASFPWGNSSVKPSGAGGTGSSFCWPAFS